MNSSMSPLIVLAPIKAMPYVATPNFEFSTKNLVGRVRTDSVPMPVN